MQHKGVKLIIIIILIINNFKQSWAANQLLTLLCIFIYFSNKLLHVSVKINQLILLLTLCVWSQAVKNSWCVQNHKAETAEGTSKHHKNEDMSGTDFSQSHSLLMLTEV